MVPTFLELAGGKGADQDFDGKPFAAVLRGEKTTHHDFVFATHTTRGIYNGSEAYATRAVTDGNFLFIRNLHADESFQNMVTAKDEIFRSWKTVDSDFARERVLSYQKRPAEELFDLKSDAWCQKNLAMESGLVEKRTTMQAELDSWMKQQGDLGDATERDAENRQPKLKPWSKNGSYPSQN